MRPQKKFRTDAELFHADTCDPLKLAVKKGDLELKSLARGTYPGTPLPPGTAPGLLSVGVWDAIKPQKWGLDWHQNEGIEIGFLMSGKLSFSTKDRAWLLDAGSLTITRPWQKHRLGNPAIEESRYAWIIIDVGIRRPNQPWEWPSWVILSEKEKKQLIDFLRLNENPIWKGGSNISRAFAELCSDLKSNNKSNSTTLIQLSINRILLEVLQHLQSQKPRLNPTLLTSERTVKLFIQKIEERFNEPWNLETMAQECGLARSRFTHYFHTCTNQTPIEYLTHLRLKKAIQMIRSGSSITDAAFECGFNSSQYFATVFLKKYRTSPRNFLQKDIKF